MGRRKRKIGNEGGTVVDGSLSSCGADNGEVILDGCVDNRSVEPQPCFTTKKQAARRTSMRRANVNTPSSSTELICVLGNTEGYDSPTSVTTRRQVHRRTSMRQLNTHFKDKQLHFHRCCENGRVSLPQFQEPPLLLKQLLDSRYFTDNIRAYNQMFSMTSYGAKTDDTIDDGRSPYVFKVFGQIYHWIGSMCPQQGVPPRFLQLYIYETDHEFENRMSHFGGQYFNRLCSLVVSQLIELLDTHNELVKLFRIARDKCRDSEVPTFCVRLFSVSGSRQHALPTSDAIGAIVFDSGPRATTDYDVIVEPRGEVPRCINKLHPMYMSPQFPLMFFYGEPGFHLGLMLRDVPGSPAGRERKMTMNMYYNYQIHDRLGVYSLMLRMGRLFQQYVVMVYCSIELNRMDYIRHKQKDIRNEYLSGLYDAIDRGDQTGANVGSRTILPASFTDGPRYMYSHYLDALAICRVYENPQFFITFTCNVKWPEIARFLQPYTLLTPSDRADVVTRVFHLRVGEFVAFLKEEQPLVYSEESSMRSSFRSERIDDYISAELPDPRTDLVGYAVIYATMMHGPCGLAKSSAPCMELSDCSKKFPKLYNSKTYFDADGRAHYRRRNTGIYATRSGVKLDNSYIVHYNLLLCLTFYAHINVEFCGWTMLIKYLFKYISKGTDRVAARITRPVGNTDAQQSQVPKAIDEIQNFIDARFICPHEACWRIFNFPIHHREPAV
ncbi:uncharacterized protein [Rutidosis leptorrhynchoides]|uniref:uncharacterized protein n=1 Tax=Rutidosis leptorrhynchoides TaxID=125765 RepID=UPI003A98FABB